MPRLTLLGGVGEVGGNKVMLEEDGRALFLDFGTSYARRGRYYEEYLNPRSGFGLLDLLEMDLLPPLEGLYRPDLHPWPDAPEALWETYRHRHTYRDLRGLEVLGVLCSHGHLDHSGYISLLREDVPVVSTLLSALVMKAVQDCTRSDIELEVVYAVPRVRNEELGVLEASHYKTVPARQRRFLVFGPTPGPEADAFWGQTPGTRPLESRPFQLSPRELCLGPFLVRCFPVDHSIPAAAGPRLPGWPGPPQRGLRGRPGLGGPPRQPGAPVRGHPRRRPRPRAHRRGAGGRARPGVHARRPRPHHRRLRPPQPGAADHLPPPGQGAGAAAGHQAPSWTCWSTASPRAATSAGSEASTTAIALASSPPRRWAGSRTSWCSASATTT